MSPADGRVHRRARALCAAIVVIAAVAVSAGLFARYLPEWRQLWTDVIHDRNAHLDFGLGGASDLLHLRAYELARDVNWFRTWPPLHDGVMVGLAMMLSGLDPRFGVLPSLACFAATALIAFRLAGRLVYHGASAAGLVAALFVLVSPAGRAFATDVMIEGPGAFFTLAALYAAVIVRQRGNAEDWRWLALALSGVFFTKYNYWLLVVAALPPIVLRADRVAIRALARWHLLPAAVWLAIPGKLERFFWVLWPGSNAGEFPASDRLAGFGYYARAAAVDYHVAPWSAAAAGALLLVAAGAWWRGRLRAGAGILFLFVAVAIVATAPHPNRKSRFLHSWIPAVWVLAGAGVSAFSRVDANGGSGRRARVPLDPAVAAAALTIAAHVPGLWRAPHAPEGGLRFTTPSALEIAEAYLPYLQDSRRPAILSNMPVTFFARWTYLDRYGRGQRPETVVPGVDSTRISTGNAQAVRRWLDAGTADTIVYIDIPRGSPWYQVVPGEEGLEQLGPLLATAGLTPVFDRTLPERGGTRVTVLVRHQLRPGQMRLR